MAVKKTAQSGQKSNISPGQRKSTEPARQLLLTAFKTTKSEHKKVSKQSKINALKKKREYLNRDGLLTGVNQSTRFNNAAANKKSMSYAKKRNKNLSIGMISPYKDIASRYMGTRDEEGLNANRIKKDRR